MGLELASETGIVSFKVDCLHLMMTPLCFDKYIFSVADTGDLRSVQISTVDAFQGGERHVIILSCVRSNSSVFIDNDK